MYGIALWLHVTGAALLFLAMGAEVFASVRLRRAGDVRELRAAAHTAHATGPVHGVASLLLLGFGIYMAVDRDGWSLTTGWILASFVATLSFSIIGPAVVAKRMAAIVELVDAAPDGDADPQLSRAVNDPVLWTLFHGMALTAFAIIYLMTNKPGAAGSWAVVVGAFVVGAAAGRMTAQRSASQLAADPATA